jgi:hypothetical protein
MNGPGTELAALLKAEAVECGIGLEALISRMDAWGVEGCNPRMDAIVDELLGESVAAPSPGMSPQPAIVVQQPSLWLRRRLEGCVTQAIEAARAQDPTLLRHLMFHIMPTPGVAWRWHADRLIRNLHLFNGRRVIAIVTGPGLEPPESVQAVFANHRVDRWIIRPNDPNLGEAVTFPEMLTWVQQEGWGVTFYGHAKGATQWTRSIECWCAAMHQQLLAEWQPRVQEALRRFPVVGAFRRVGDLPPVSVPWHFSGTFFWFQNAAVRGRPAPMTSRHAVEEWPARMFRLEDSACVYADQCSSLYDESYWDRLPAWNTAALFGRRESSPAPGVEPPPVPRQTRLFYEALAFEQAGDWRGAWKTLCLAAVARRTSRRIGRWNILVAMLRVSLTWFRVALPRTYAAVRSIYRGLCAPFARWTSRRRPSQPLPENVRHSAGPPLDGPAAPRSGELEDQLPRHGVREGSGALTSSGRPEL